MSNMSYCRFRNTLSDLRDCAENIGEEVSSSEEARARRALVALCREISDDWTDEDGVLHESLKS